MESPGSGSFEPFETARMGPVELRNRIIKAATFEGMSPDGVVTDELVRFHVEMARGGVGMTTLAYVAVSPDGRGAPAELVIGDRIGEGLERLVGEVHAEGARISAQLGHAGAVGELPGKRPVGPSAMRTATGAKVHQIGRVQIDEVVEQFAAGAAVLAAAGFDAIELHFGHHYLVSSFLSPRWNRRDDDYGGDVAGRSLLARRILRAVGDAVGPSVAVTAKLNMADGVRGGLQVGESIEVAKLLAAEGVLDALELTAGGSLRNQMYMFRGPAPRRDLATVLTPLQGWGLRILGPLVMRGYPFDEAYLLSMAREFRRELDLPLILLGGINELATITSALAEGFEFVAMGRALLREPDLVRRMEQGVASTASCIHCNRCMVSVFSGTRCVIDHPEPSAPR